MPLDSAPYTKMGSTMLASQPVSAGRDRMEEMRDWTTMFNHVERRLKALRAWRWTWLSTWMDLAAFFLPRRAKWWITPNLYSRGRFLNDQIIDSTGVQAMNVCASGLWSGLTNPSRPWFKFDVAEEGVELDEEAREYLQDLEVKAAAILHGSNFYSTTAQMFQDVTVFGTSPIIVYEDEEDVIRLYNPCAGEHFLAAGARFSVDTLYREFTLTVAQIVEMFTLEACHESVRKLWEEGQIDHEFVICHAIEPNFPLRGPGGRDVQMIPTKFVFREVYWRRGYRDQGPLSMRGFHERPFMVARWWLVSNDAYGRSPCMDALGDNKQIQQETLRKAEFLEKGVRPPMIASPELKNEPLSVMPGMITFVNTANTQSGFKPAFEVNAVWLQHLTADIKDVGQRIKDALYVPQFMAITQMQGVQPKNELELTKRDLERLQMLGPVIDLFENDVANPVLQRVVAIMQRKGMVGPLPQSLRGVQLKIKYSSIMRLAQRASESVSLKDGFATGGQLSLAAKNAGVPDPMRIVNWDKAYRMYLEMNNFPANVIYPSQTVERHDAERAQAIQQEKSAQAMSSMAPAAVDAAGILSKTPVPGNSYLNQILSGSTLPGGQ
jgi:hypothetical protein